MSSKEDEIPVEIKSEKNNPKSEKPDDLNHDNESIINELQELLAQEKQKFVQCEDKLKRSLADYQNLERKTKLDIENGINTKIDKLMLNFLSIYDDFVRAKTALSDEKINIEGLDAILKNMDTLLSQYGVTPINALGEIFDPNIHEAISVVNDPTLDEGTITKEIRKGYISQNRVIRPTIVEISKKSEQKESNGD